MFVAAPAGASHTAHTRASYTPTSQPKASSSAHSDMKRPSYCFNKWQDFSEFHHRCSVVILFIVLCYSCVSQVSDMRAVQLVTVHLLVHTNVYRNRAAEAQSHGHRCDFGSYFV